MTRLPRHRMAWRMLRHAAPLLPLLLAFLALGVAIYRYADHRTWADAFLNAAMLMGGMGPVGDMHSTAAKYLAGTYALLAGIVFLVVAGVMLAPVIHEGLRLFHLERER
jgi:uncharacterized membrane protein